MRLADLDPRWIEKDGKRVGFTFVSPTNSAMRQSCFPDPPPSREQWKMFDALHGVDRLIVQGCNPDHHWQIAGGIEGASFETLTVTPSLDGSAGGLWHGSITNGEIVGGLNA